MSRNGGVRILTALSCPYFAGNNLAVQINDENSSGQASESLDVTVCQAFDPFTLSCALLVQLDWPSLKLKGQYVLKLFDRRFAAQLRREHKACSWTPEVEDNYRNFVHSGGLRELVAFIAEKETDDYWSARKQKDWNQAQLEAYLQYCSRKFYKTETAVYYRLHELQGQDIPRFIARVVIRRTSSDPVDEYLDCPGILLEYIQGFPLTDIEEFAPKAAWQPICDEAIRIINRISNLNVRNEDVKTRSFMVQPNPDPDTAQFKLCMMDFGSCVLRKPDQDDHDWREWKAMQDEEGAIGLVMERKLRGGFKYTPSLEYEQLIYEFQRERV
jgi:hypothetical protein